MTHTTPKLRARGHEYAAGRGWWMFRPHAQSLWEDLTDCPIWLEFSTRHTRPDEQAVLYFCTKRRHGTLRWGRTHYQQHERTRDDLSKWLLEYFPQLKNGRTLRLYVRVLYEVEVTA